MAINKKAAIEVQFNWMFVLIAGAIILSFFVVFILQQKAASEQKLSAALIKDLETKITSARVSGGSAAELELNDMEILFTCEDYRMKGVSESINYRSIFSPDRVKGTSLLLWSMPWSIPFKVTNLLFITSPDVRYLIFDTNTDSALAKSVYERMSNKFFTVDLVDGNTLPKLDLSKGYKVKLVCFNCDDDLKNNVDVSRFVNFADPDVSAVSINPSFNKINFYRVDNTHFVLDGESPFFGMDSNSEASMYAAIFADNKGVYDCNMKKALGTFGVVAQVYSDRIKAVQNDSNLLPASCKDFYNVPIEHLNNMILTSQKDFDSNTVSSLEGDAKFIDNYQNNYIRRQSCPLVY